MFLLIFFTLVTLSHGIFLMIGKRSKYENFRKKLWSIHYSINGFLWITLLIWILLVQFNFAKVEFPLWGKTIGLVLFFTGTILSFINVKRLGLPQAMGFRFFSSQKLQWISGGSYSFLKNPIYDGFVLIFLGAGLWGGVIINFYLALASFLLLNVFLASIEKEKTKLSLKEIF